MKLLAIFSISFVTFVTPTSMQNSMQCYVCTSSTVNCQKNYFVDFGISKQGGCGCCRKAVSSDGSTVRECVSGTDVYQCTTSTQGSYVCYEDLCNRAIASYGRSAALVAVSTTVALAIDALLK